MKRIEHRGEVFCFPNHDEEQYNKSFSRLLSMFKRLIDGKAANQVHTCGFEFEDWQQVGAIALMEAVDRYDPAAFDTKGGTRKPRSFFSYFRSTLIRKLQAQHSKYNLQVKISERNKYIDRKIKVGAVLRNNTEKVSPLVGRYIDTPFVSVDSGDETRPNVRKIAKATAPVRMEWGKFFESLSRQERVVIEGVLDDKVLCMTDLDKVRGLFKKRIHLGGKRTSEIVRGLRLHPQVNMLVELTV